MPAQLFRKHMPDRIKSTLGSDSSVCIINGKIVYSHLLDLPFIIMACNPRIAHVIPGIMRAAEELDAIIAFELTATEGGLDGGYTGQTPSQFVNTLIEYAEKSRFTKPFIVHADHITVKDGSAQALDAARGLITAQIEAGYSSFAIDASFNPLADNIRIVTDLAQPLLKGGLGLEVELGEVAPVGLESNLTTVEEVDEFLSGLATAGITPQLLAIANGSKSGNYLDGQLVKIDLERTGEIFEAARRFGLSGLVQHGITGTPQRIVGKLCEYGIRKGNIGTMWQNVAHAGLPPELVDRMRDWSRENKRDIKYATSVFRAEIDDISREEKRVIEEMAYREAREFITAFNAKGSSSRLAGLLGKESCE